MRVTLMNITTQQYMLQINKTLVSCGSPLETSSIWLHFSYDSLRGEEPMTAYNRLKKRKKKKKNSRNKQNGKKLVDWYDETFITSWESSQSDLYFSTPCWNQTEWNRNADANLHGEICEIGHCKRIFWLRHLMAIQTD